MCAKIFRLLFLIIMLLKCSWTFNLRYMKTKIEELEAANKLRKLETEEIFQKLSELETFNMTEEWEERKISYKNTEDGIILSKHGLQLLQNYVLKGMAYEKEANRKLRSSLQGMREALETGYGKFVEDIESRFDNLTTELMAKQRKTKNFIEQHLENITNVLQSRLNKSIESMQQRNQSLNTKFKKFVKSLNTKFKKFVKKTESQISNFKNNLTQQKEIFVDRDTFVSMTHNISNTEHVLNGKIEDIREILKTMGFSFKTLEQNHPVSCSYLLKLGHNENREYVIYPNTLPNGIRVFCDQITDGGGWIVFHRRRGSSDYFHRGWADYKAGFGNLQGEFWLGNDNLYALTSSGFNELRIEVEFIFLRKFYKYRKYSNFRIKSESENYQLEVSGNDNDTFSRLSGMAFSTKDRDNDIMLDRNCAEIEQTGWWFRDCEVKSDQNFEELLEMKIR